VTYRDVLDELVLRLMDAETISKNEVLEVFATVQKRPGRGSYTGVGRRMPSDRPPVQTPAELGVATDVAGLVRRGTANGKGKSGAGSGGSSGGGGGNGSVAPRSPSQPSPDGATRPVPGSGSVSAPGADAGSGQSGTPAPTPESATTQHPAEGAPRISNPWAPPSWPNDDERRRR
jgi:cell division protease FtsH